MTVVRADRIEVHDRLAKMALTVEELHEVLTRAEAERRTCTGFDPPGLPGSVFWGRVVRFLRETYVPKGWKARNVDQLPLLINLDRSLAITASSGDWATGVSSLYTPKSRYPKGAATGRRVEANGQATIPGLPAELTEDADEDDSLATWVLLYFHEKGEEQTKLLCELSLPLEVGAQGKINKWSERLILPPLEFPEDVIGLGGTEDDEGPDAIDVPIERRGS
jgi:hypothetical protein